MGEQSELREHENREDGRTKRTVRTGELRGWENREDGRTERTEDGRTNFENREDGRTERMGEQ